MAAEESVNRLNHARRFYDLLEQLAALQGGPRPLADVIASLKGQLGVYFFLEPGEARQESGRGSRVVRVGTHALKAGASSTLRGRLRQHGGSRAGGGNHRGSIYRLLTGDALIRSGIEPSCLSWGGKDAVKHAELATEQAVSRRLSTTNVVWVNIDDQPGPDSLRGWIERNSIALLSNAGKQALDPPSSDWLGHHSSRLRVQASGLWNQNHVDEAYDPAFLDDFESLINR